MESLQVNKEIKGLPGFVGKQVLPVLDKKQDPLKNVLRTRLEKVEECVQNQLDFRDDQVEEEDELLLAMKEINKRREELKVSQKEQFSALM